MRLIKGNETARIENTTTPCTLRSKKRVEGPRRIAPKKEGGSEEKSSIKDKETHGRASRVLGFQLGKFDTGGTMRERNGLPEKWGKVQVPG